MNNCNNLFIYLIFVLAFTIFILLLNEPQFINENFNDNLYNWRDLYNNNRRDLYNNNNNNRRDLYNNNNNNRRDEIYDIFYNLPLFRYLENRDRSVLYDPLVAPERRIQNDQYPYPLIYNNLVNYPTRGYPDNYQQLGIITRNNDEKILQLFGRPTFPGSNQWEYYVKSEKEGFVNKIPIQSKNQKELQDGDNIDVPGMNSNNGNFNVKLFNYNTPRYNPRDY
jgi:hypothetical protein